MNSFELERDDIKHSGAVLETLREWGIVTVDGFLEEDTVSALNREFEDALDHPGEDGVQPVDYDSGNGAKLIRDDLNEERFPCSSRLFSSDWMREIADEYIGTPNLLNSVIYLTHDIPRDEYINSLHFDRMETLKFFFYLLDTTKKNGAFECVPGSHHDAKEILETHKSWGGRIANAPNQHVPPDLDEPISIEGSAGTLIIFTTNVFHRGGRVSNGTERRVMRGHTRTDPPPTYNPDLFSSQWFRESYLNPCKIVGKLTGKI